MVYKLTSINTVIRKILTDLQIDDKETPIDNYIEWIAEGLEYVGAYYQFVEKEATIDIDDYKAELPCDLYKIILINNKTDISPQMTNSLLIGETPRDIKRNGTGNNVNTININGGIITSSTQKTTLYLKYLAFPLDCDGYLQVPDDINFKDALMWKVTERLALGGYVFKNEYLNNYEYVRKMWGKYRLQATSTANMPDIMQLENIKNNWKKLIPKDDYLNNFANFGSQERLNLSGNRYI